MRVSPEAAFLPPLDVHTTPSSWDGTLFHLLGQGMGDTVNALRVVDALQSLYPRSRPVVYCDKRWTDFVEKLSGVEIRHYPLARDPRHPKQGIVGPYNWAIKEIRRSRPKNARLGYWGYLQSDQLARGESTQESIVRTLGLDRVIPEFRPMVVTGEKDNESARILLKQYGLTVGKYLVMAPHTWPDKDWGKENFRGLGQKLFKEFGIPTVVLGLSELGGLDFDGAINLFQIPLGVTAELISRSSLFIGLDSGLSHVAAAYEVPLIVLYANGRIPAFEIRVHSPCAWLFLETLPGVPISGDQVFILASHLLRQKVPITVTDFSCPACQRPLRYVLEVTSERINRRCVCGTQVFEGIGQQAPLRRNDPPDNKPDHAEEMLSRHVSFPDFFYGSEHLKDFLERAGIPDQVDTQNPKKKRTVDFAMRDPYVPCLLKNEPLSMKEGAIVFSLDGLLFFFRSFGYFPLKAENKKNSSASPAGWHRLIIEFSQEEGGPVSLEFPWGGRKLKLSSVREYFTWFSWQSWATPLRWNGLPKRAIQTGHSDDAVRVALRIFRMAPSFKSLKYYLKYLVVAWYFRIIDQQEFRHDPE